MSFWSTTHLQAVTAGRWLVPPAAEAGALQGLSIDSRAISPGQVFLALKGEHFDGHDFLAQAAQKAGLLIVADETKAPLRPVQEVDPRRLPHPPAAASGGAGQPLVGMPPVPSPQTSLARTRLPILLVPDTLAALQRLGAAYRDHLHDRGCKVIAITGSNGKTTTRHLIHTVLSSRFRGTQSPKSFNNHIGVPLTLLAAGEMDNFVVVETGTNHPGELAALGAIVRPDAVVLTSIGEEHMEFFGDLAGVAREEAAMLPWRRPEALVVIAEQAWPYVQPLYQPQPGERLIRYGAAPGDEQATLQAWGLGSAANGGWSFQVQGTKFEVPLPGRHNALNALATLAVGRWMGMEDAAIATALRTARPAEHRGEVLHLGPAGAGLTLIDDAYNANPASMRQALGVLAGFPPPAAGGRRVAVLGDMLELGSQAPDLHRQVGDTIASRYRQPPDQVDHVITIGRLAMFIAEALARGGWPGEAMSSFAQWSDDLPSRVAGLLKPGDVVLIKASRGMKLERLIVEMEKMHDR